MKKAIFGVFKNENQAQKFVDLINNAHYSITDISLLVPANKVGGNAQGNADYSKNEQKSSTGSSWSKQGNVSEEESHGRNAAASSFKSPAAAPSSAHLSGSLGKLSNISTINIPGAGSFYVAGPVKSQLSNVSGSNGAIAQILISYGIKDSDAKRYEDKVKKGQLIMFYNSDQVDQLNKVKEFFNQAGAEDVYLSAGEVKAAKKAKV